MASIRRIIFPVIRVTLYGMFGALLVLLVGFIFYLDGRPDLEVWHTVELDEEFNTGSPVESFADYLALEERLFAQLDAQVYAHTGAAREHEINRYRRGGLADPKRWAPDWNRSYLFEAQRPRAKVLLLHGLSDSPYSLRHMAQRLHSAGATVLGLRIPGHGTAPSGLVKVRWQDMAAAVQLAVQHLASISPPQPIYIVGYSNGAALGVYHVLATLDDPSAPRVAGLILLSPEIGVTPVAGLAVWQARIGHLLGMDKLAWNEILPEYEPFKYASFAVNAGDISHRITGEIQREITRLQAGGKLVTLPPILAFSSVIDATVRAPALVSNLFNRIPAGGHELVLFDINRQAEVEQILSWSPDGILNALQQAPQDTFTLALVTNENDRSSNVVVRRWRQEKRELGEEPLDLAWPAGVYSLSHVALPFAPDDPLYGGYPSEPSPGIQLGNIYIRGERGALAFSEAYLVRLRWNPFYPYLEERAVAFVGLE
jgi:alpha-beta hydrolase superfamily lysophospholipase